MNSEDSEVVKNCMDALARRIAETVLSGEPPRSADSLTLMALSLYRLDDEGIEIVGPVAVFEGDED